MTTIRRAVTRTSVAVALLAGAIACSNGFLEVNNPNVIDASEVDPASSAATLAASAQQNFATAVGTYIQFSSHFTGETYIMETSGSQNEFGRREVSELNGQAATQWREMSLAAASAKLLLDLPLPNPTTNIHIARAATFRGFAMLFMATDFCSGTLTSGPELTNNQMLDSAIVWFTKGVDVGTANASADGLNLARASLVGRARAKLQKGDRPGALADATSVPAAFTINLTYVDDLANRARLSNALWRGTVDRSVISVPPYYQTTDPRVRFLAPGQHPYNAWDAAAGPYYVQQKYTGYASPIRLASKLEAEYIAAEASGDNAQMLALINRQRAAFGYAAYSGPTDATSVLTELFDQKRFDFWLEGKRLADWRRQPVAAARHVPVSGTPYWRPNLGSIGRQTCYPLPFVERDNNPNIKKG
jgi:starch-binding outer membrane protein, SusD/RagB family